MTYRSCLFVFFLHFIYRCSVSVCVCVCVSVFGSLFPLYDPPPAALITSSRLLAPPVRSPVLPLQAGRRPAGEMNIDYSVADASAT